MSKTGSMYARILGAKKQVLTRTKKVSKQVISGLFDRRTLAGVLLGGAVLYGAQQIPYGRLPGADRVSGLVQSTASAAAKVVAPPTLDDLTVSAKNAPTDARAQLALGHAEFQAERRALGIGSYDRALSLDRALASDATLLKNLVSAYGTKEQAAAQALVLEHGLIGAEDGLRALVTAREYRVRWGAVDTLKGLRRSQPADRIQAWKMDLGAKDCAVRKNAVAQLGLHGDRSVMTALKSADERDEDETPWYARSCLGNEPAKAAERILARR